MTRRDDSATLPAMIVDRLLAEVEGSQEELVALAQGLIRVKTVNTGTMPTGNETEACIMIMNMLKKEKIEAEIIESEPTRGSIIATLPAETAGRRARLLLLSHLDVVPVGDEKQWRHPPFGGSVHEGRIYGRGAWDCKGLTASHLMTLIILKRLNVKLDRPLVLAATADEETASGGERGIGYLVRHERGRIESEYVLNEGGGASVDTPDGLYYLVSIGEKGRSEVTIDFHGKSCHASQPWSGRNPLMDMAATLVGIEAYTPEISMDQDMLAKLFKVFRLTGTPDGTTFLRVLEKDLKETRIYSDLRGNCSMTIAPTVAAAGYKANVIPEKGSLTCDIRTLFNQDEEYVRTQLERIMGRLAHYTVTFQKNIPASRSRADPYFLRIIADALSRITFPKAKLMETLSIGYTDSSVIRQTGATAFGFEPAHPLSDPRMVNFHSTDESIAIADLVFRTKAYLSICHDMLIEPSIS